MKGKQIVLRSKVLQITAEDLKEHSFNKQEMFETTINKFLESLDGRIIRYMKWNHWDWTLVVIYEMWI